MKIWHGGFGHTPKTAVFRYISIEYYELYLYFAEKESWVLPCSHFFNSQE